MGRSPSILDLAIAAAESVDVIVAHSGAGVLIPLLAERLSPASDGDRVRAETYEWPTARMTGCRTAPTPSRDRAELENVYIVRSRSARSTTAEVVQRER